MIKFFNKNKEVYLDYSATTPVDKKVFEKMKPFFTEKFANPSSLYTRGVENFNILESCRKDIAVFFHANKEEIIFTSGGTESDNMAILGVAMANREKGNHIITTEIEHPAVLEVMKNLEKQGFEVTYLKSDSEGFITTKQVKESITEKTILISIMMANNEIGTIEPIAEIGKEILKWRKNKNTEFPYFHSDACQAVNTIKIDVEKMHLDLFSINGSKIYGPKGVGVLYKRKNVKIEPIIFGGGQENNFRSGTENLAGIVGIIEALKLVEKDREVEIEKIRKIRDYFYKQIKNKIKDIKLNGPKLEEKDKRLVNNLNVSFLGIEGEALVLYLDSKGIMCSTGSACSSKKLQASHVLRACDLDFLRVHSSIRFSLGKYNTKSDIDYVMRYLPELVEKLRKMSSVK